VSSPPTAVSLLKALRRRWLLATTVGLLGAVLAAGVGWFLLPAPPHTARSQLYVASDPPRVLFQTNEARSEAGAFRQTQMALLKSRLVLNAALRQPKAAETSLIRSHEEPVAWLEKELKVLAGASPEILSVSLSGDLPEEQKVLVDAVVNSYMQEIVNKEQIKRQARLDHLKTIAAQYDEQLRRKRRTMRDLAENVGSTDKQALALKQLFSVEQYHLTQKELLQVRSELRKLQTEAAGEGTGNSAAELPQQAINDVVQSDPIMVRHQAAKLRLEEEMEDAKRKLVKGADHPAVKRYVQEIAATSQLIDRRREELRPQIEARARERAKLEASQLHKRIEFCQRLEKQLAEDVKRLEDETRLQNKGAFDLGTLQTEIAQAEEVARKVAEEVEKLTVETQGAPARVSVLEEAVIDWGDGQTRQMRNAVAAGLVCLSLILLGIAWWEFRTHRLETVDQVVHELGMKLMGALPATRPVRPNTTQGAYQSAFHESVAAARTMLLHMARSESLQVVMVSSAVAGEGKTSLSCQLSTSLAKAGHKVLLVDADLRKPDAHRVLGGCSKPGLSELLRGEVGVVQSVRRTTIANLWLIAAGNCDGRALQALAQGRLKHILEDVREMFEFVIFDSSPVLPIADAVQVGQHVDGVIFSVLRNVSRLPRVHAASQRLIQLGVRVLGAVVLGAQAEAERYGYSYAAAQEK
jgi:capsular exopolysaccharide synthesis family protein